MNQRVVDQLTPKVITLMGLVFLALVGGLGHQLFGNELAVGLGVGMVIGVINFKAIAFILKRVLGPNTINKILYGIFGFLKFTILVVVFFVLIRYEVFNVYGVVAGFSAVLLLVLIEGMVRASRLSADEFTEEEVNA